MSEQDFADPSGGLALFGIQVVYEAGWWQRPSCGANTPERPVPDGLVPVDAAGAPNPEEAASDLDVPAVPNLPAAAGEATAGGDPAEVPTGMAPVVMPPSRDDPFAPLPPRRTYSGPVASLTAVCLLLPVGFWYFAAGPDACWLSVRSHDETLARLAADVVARRIVKVESNGDADAKNPRSSATGAGQFLDGTWLDMIRAYRPDLHGRAEAEILELRYDPAVSREMVARFAEENAAMLGRRCLPITPGTLYLSHFAGGAGAAAVLLAPETADAATTMADADSTGRTTREMIVTANPFLAKFTVADLKRWADRKMGIVDGWQL